MGNETLTSARLEKLFPASRADEFFDAIYGGAEEGAYDIALVSKEITDKRAEMAFELKKREGHCLKCSLTYGLPEVFKRHPILNVGALARDIGEILGWGTDVAWQLYPVREINDDLHVIPFVIERKS